MVFGFSFAAATSDLMSEGRKFGFATIASGEDATRLIGVTSFSGSKPEFG